jgi:hypothetical protein
MRADSSDVARLCEYQVTRSFSENALGVDREAHMRGLPLWADQCPK